MNCTRSQELLSDDVEGTLAPPLATELEEHLAACGECRELRDALAAVMDALAPESLPEPPADLHERILAKTLPSVRQRVTTGSEPVLFPSGWPAAASFLAAAAVFVLVLLWRPPGVLSDWSREASRTARQVYSFGVRTASDAQRFVAELNVLRMTVGVAFEDRLDRLNERLRALDEATRRTGKDDADEDPDSDSSSRALPDTSIASRIPFDQRSHS